MRIRRLLLGTLLMGCAGPTPAPQAPLAPIRCEEAPRPIELSTLPDVDAADSARCISGSLIIGGTLADVVLSQLQTVEGDVVISDADSLRSVSLPRLQRVTGSLLILDAPQLDRVDLPMLTTVGADLLVGREYPRHLEQPTRTRGTGLKRLEGPRLTDIGALRIQSNPELKAIVLPALQRISRSAAIIDNARLSSILIAPLADLSGGLRIVANPSLVDIAGLAGRQVVQGPLELRNNRQLRDLSGLATLEDVRGRLTVAGLAALTDLELPALIRVGRGLRVIGNPRLAQLRLPSLGSLFGYAEISDNPLLVSIAFDRATTINGHVNITNDEALQTVSFPALTNIAGDLGLVDVPKLHRVNAPALQTVANDLVLRRAASLSALSFQALTEIGGYLTVEGNPKLASLTDLGPIRSIREQIYVRGNASLPACHGSKLAERLTRPPRLGMDVGANGPPC